MDSVTNLILGGISVNDKVVNPKISILIGNSNYEAVVNDFPASTNASQLANSIEPTAMFHYIETEGPPAFSKSRHLSPKLFKTTLQEFEFLISEGIIRPFSCPLHLVQKSNREWHLCNDYCHLNTNTIPNCYPLPHIQNCMQIFHNKQISFTIDLMHAYHQIPVNPANIPKTALT